MCVTINPFNPTEKPIDGEGANVEWLTEEEIGKEGGKLNVQLFDKRGQPIAPFIVHFFSSKLYENILQKAGFIALQGNNPYINSL